MLQRIRAERRQRLSAINAPVWLTKPLFWLGYPPVQQKKGRDLGPPDSASPIPLLRRDRGDPDRARHTGTAQPAIAHRVLGEVLLMIVLGEIERRRLEDLGGDGAVMPRLQRLL